MSAGPMSRRRAHPTTRKHCTQSRRPGTARPRLTAALFFPFAAALFAVGCSSAPKPATEVFDTHNKAAQYEQYGNRYYNQGDYNQALQFYRMARKLSAALDDRSAIVVADNAIGRASMALGRMSEANASFEEAAQIALAIGDRRLQIQVAADRASLQLALGKPDAAVALLEPLDTPENAKAYQSETAVVVHNLGAAYAAKDDYSRAEEYLARAIELNGKPDAAKKTQPDSGIDRERELASNHYLLASVHAHIDEYDAARTEIESALEIDKKIENAPGIASDLYGLARVLEESGNRNDAYDAYRRALFGFVALNWVDQTRATLDRLEPLARDLGKNDELAQLESMKAALDADAPTSGSTATSASSSSSPSSAASASPSASPAASPSPSPASSPETTGK